jgi:hypothetical protein
VRSTARAYVAVTVAAAGALLTAQIGTAAESASRIIDRTVVCRAIGTGFPDPIRFITASASPRNEGLDVPPILSAHNGPSGEGGLSAFVQTGPDPGHATGYVGLSRTGCTTTRVRLPLSRKGLRGVSTEPDGESYDCDVPARILIRVRAVFTRPTRFARDPRSPWLSVARGTMATGYLAVATMPARKPLSFSAASHATGKAQLFVSPSLCRERP